MKKTLHSIKRILTLLKNKEKRHAYDTLLNLILVIHGGRKAYLFETIELLPDHEKDVTMLLTLSKEIGLFVKKDPLNYEHAPRYWISREKLEKIPETDVEMGTLLGFKDPGAEYNGYKKKSLSLRIAEKKTDTIILVEVLLGDKEDAENQAHASDLIHRFDTIMKELELPYRFEFGFNQNDGTLKRVEELTMENMSYLKMHEHDYISDIWNEDIAIDHPIILLFKRCVNDSSLLHRFLPFYLYLYRVINKQILSKDELEIKKQKINKAFTKIIVKKISCNKTLKHTHRKISATKKHIK